VDRLLETPRLILRPLLDTDADDLARLQTDPEVMRFLDPSPLERFYTAGFFAAIQRGTGRFVGWFCLEPKGEDEYELGYRLYRWAWGQGLATEGSKALVQLGFEVWAAQRIFAETMAVNSRSRRVMEKAGLRYIRSFHVEWPDPLPGAEHGEVEYAFTRAEYFADPPPSAL
jgi:RimJ/RimL family protein N-acetyltransferase